PSVFASSKAIRIEPRLYRETIGRGLLVSGPIEGGIEEHPDRVTDRRPIGDRIYEVVGAGENILVVQQRGTAAIPYAGIPLHIKIADGAARRDTGICDTMSRHGRDGLGYWRGGLEGWKDWLDGKTGGTGDTAWTGEAHWKCWLTEQGDLG